MPPIRREHLLKVLLLLAIFGLAGPELAPAIELSLLLEMLGATLFLVAYGAALEMLAMDFLRGLKGVFLPTVPVTILCEVQARPSEKSGAVAYLVANGLICLCHFALFGVLLAWIVR
jgi:hypothetical protein